MKKSRDFSRNLLSRDWIFGAWDLWRGGVGGVGRGGPASYHSSRASPHSDLEGISIDHGFVFYIIHLFCCLLFA